ncbi:ABC transporter substrate-binding protein [Phascolarctobacterium faecium]|uniref:ABC transporter substrate-binding protein n=1 Tax=Phascolarctobacterium faecium TaxID=33025 RepID=UPI003FEDF3F1
MKKKLSCMLSLSLAAVMVCGCGADRKKEPLMKDSVIISVGTYMTGGGYDPTAGYGQWGPDIFHSSLLRLNDKNEVVNDLVTDYQVSSDGLTYKFFLRKDVKFADGQPLTAKDVVFTYEKARNGGSTVDLTMLDSVTAPDDYTVVFNLKKPWSVFIDNTVAVGIVPQHAYKDGYANHPIGSGPWKVTQFQKEQQLILEPNEYYYGTKPHLKKVTILKMDEDAALAAAKSGKLDLVYVNADFAKNKVDGMRLETVNTVSGFAVNLPTVPETAGADGKTVGNNVTCDPAVRQALNIGIDRAAIVKNALNGFGVPAYNLSPALPWASDFGEIDNQVEKAKELLEAAGWKDTDGDGIREKNGQKAEILMRGRANDLQRYNIIVALAQEAKKLGIDITAKAAPWSEARVARQIPTCWDLGYFNPLLIYQNFYSGSIGVNVIGNSASYSNSSVDGHIEAALRSVSLADAVKNWQLSQWDGQAGTKADVPYLWIANPQNTYFVKEGLDIGKQKVNVRGQGMSIVYNMNEWQWK